MKRKQQKNDKTAKATKPCAADAQIAIVSNYNPPAECPSHGKPAFWRLKVGAAAIAICADCLKELEEAARAKIDEIRRKDDATVVNALEDTFPTQKGSIAVMYPLGFTKGLATVFDMDDDKLDQTKKKALSIIHALEKSGAIERDCYIADAAGHKFTRYNYPQYTQALANSKV